MLENINLTLSDVELNQSENVKVVARLSKIVYFKPIIKVALWFTILCFLYIGKPYLEYYFKTFIDNVSFVKDIFINIDIDKKSFYSMAWLFFDVVFYMAIPILIAYFIIANMIDIIRLSKMRIIVDDTGIWVKKGLFKFTSEAQGVVWNNADLASSKNGIIYYLFNNYPIQVKNRFSGALELSLPPVQNGKNLLSTINKEISKRYTQQIQP